MLNTFAISEKQSVLKHLNLMHTILIATYIEYELFEKAFGMLCSPLLAQLIVTPSEFVVQEQMVGHDKASNGQHTTTKYTTVTSNCMFFFIQESTKL